jgi:hypothetical protein
MVGISAARAQECRMETGGAPLYRDVMTSADLSSGRTRDVVRSLWSASAWRATLNGLAAFLVAVVDLVLLGVLTLVWGAAVYSLVTWPAGSWGHIVLYVATVIAGPVLGLSAIQGLTALQRSRLRAVNGAVNGMDIPAGGTALDPEAVAQLLVRRRDDPMSRLTPREQQVLRLMAKGFAKLDLAPTATDHRRALAVLRYLRS